MYEHIFIEIWLEKIFARFHPVAWDFYEFLC